MTTTIKDQSNPKRFDNRIDNDVEPEENNQRKDRKEEENEGIDYGNKKDDVEHAGGAAKHKVDDGENETNDVENKEDDKKGEDVRKEGDDVEQDRDHVKSTYEKNKWDGIGKAVNDVENEGHSANTGVDDARSEGDLVEQKDRDKEAEGKAVGNNEGAIQNNKPDMENKRSGVKIESDLLENEKRDVGSVRDNVVKNEKKRGGSKIGKEGDDAEYEGDDADNREDGVRSKVDGVEQKRTDQDAEGNGIGKNKAGIQKNKNDMENERCDVEIENEKRDVASGGDNVMSTPLRISIMNTDGRRDQLGTVPEQRQRATQFDIGNERRTLENERSDVASGGDNATPPHFKIIIMNTHGPHVKHPGKQERKRQAIQSVVLSYTPTILLFQEFQSKGIGGTIWENYPIPEWYHYSGHKEASMLYDTHFVCVKENLDTTIRRLLEGLAGFPSDFDPLPRMSSRLVRLHSDRSFSFICISWHGPHNGLDHEKKKEYFKHLLKLLRKLHEEKNLPILIGGDFNIEMRSIENFVSKPFQIKEYQASGRRINKGVIDFFIATVELHLSDTKFIDLQDLPLVESNNESTDLQTLHLNDTLDHDPVYTLLYKRSGKEE